MASTGAVEVIILTQDTAGGATTPLSKAWVYWKQGGNVTVLHTDDKGRLFSPDLTCTDAEPFPDVSFPWVYTARYTTAKGADVDLFFSRGCKPIPTARLNEFPAVFQHRKVETPLGAPSNDPPQPPIESATVAVTFYNALAVAPTVTIILLNHNITLKKPYEVSLWPLLWESVPDDAASRIDHASNGAHTYYTEDLDQGSDLDWEFHVFKYNLTTGFPDHAPPLAADSKVRPKERGIAVEGTVDPAATAVRVRLLDATGAIVQLRQDRAATAGVNEVAAALDAVANNRKPFKVTLYLLNAAAAFGPVQLFVSEEGTNPPAVEAFFFHLAGFQTALVQDTDPTARPTVLDETNDGVIVDFIDSPEANNAAIEAKARTRRMAKYEIGIRSRPFSDTVNKNVMKPEMPIWMVEFHVVGINKDQLRQLLVWRKRILIIPGAPDTGPQSLTFEYDWKMTFSWEGPCVHSNDAPDRRYKCLTDVKESQKVEIKLAKSQQIDGVDDKGVIAHAFAADPQVIPFPVEHRRLPQVVCSGLQRAWGRRQGAVTKDSLLIEWQPRIVADDDTERIRGGDGRLILSNIRVGGIAIDHGLVLPPNSAVPAPPPDAEKQIRLPRFRVIGKNPTSADARALFDIAVESFFNDNKDEAEVKPLTLKCWQETVRRILFHESANQFETVAAHEKYGSQVFGMGKDMPIFGPPHGYGYGQHDIPKVTDDGAWSFFENIKESVRRVMEDKAGTAWGKISAHDGADWRTRAVYQREVVRQYNGHEEFSWDAAAGTWKIKPTGPKLVQNFGDAAHPPAQFPKVAYANLKYPNQVLGTAIQYWQRDAVSGDYKTADGLHEPTFPASIDFNQADYGPETQAAP
jgi:hypothetical protein